MYCCRKTFGCWLYGHVGSIRNDYIVADRARLQKGCLATWAVSSGFIKAILHHVLVLIKPHTSYVLRAVTNWKPQSPVSLGIFLKRKRKKRCEQGARKMWILALCGMLESYVMTFQWLTHKARSGIISNLGCFNRHFQSTTYSCYAFWVLTNQRLRSPTYLGIVSQIYNICGA